MNTRKLPVEIRAFEPRHLPRILQIEQECFADDPYDREIFVDLYRECPGLFLVGKVSRRIDGYIVTAVNERRAEIVSIAVVPARRRSGVATALITHTLQLLATRRCRSVELMVRVDNEPAIAFYRKFGFRRRGIAPNYYGKRRPGLRMSKALARPYPSNTNF